VTCFRYRLQNPFDSTRSASKLGGWAPIPDQELFWIIKSGIRFKGMPAFGKVETADNIWGLVNYVRTLRNTSSIAIVAASLKCV